MAKSQRFNRPADREDSDLNSFLLEEHQFQYADMADTRFQILLNVLRQEFEKCRDSYFGVHAFSDFVIEYATVLQNTIRLNSVVTGKSSLDLLYFLKMEVTWNPASRTFLFKVWHEQATQKQKDQYRYQLHKNYVDRARLNGLPGFVLASESKLAPDEPPLDAMESPLIQAVVDQVRREFLAATVDEAWDSGHRSGMIQYDGQVDEFMAYPFSISNGVGGGFVIPSVEDVTWSDMVNCMRPEEVEKGLAVRSFPVHHLAVNDPRSCLVRVVGFTSKTHGDCLFVWGDWTYKVEGVQ